MTNQQKPMLVIVNRHVAGSGMPPSFATDGGIYTSYFENAYGEQAVFQWESETDTWTLWAGDAGWDSPVVNGTAAQRPFANTTMLTFGSMVINEPEHLWLAACMAAVRQRGGGQRVVAGTK
jgi:hypothetical protein